MAGHIYGGLLIDDLECNKAGIKGEGTSVWNTKVVADLRVLIRLLNARYWLYSHPSFYGFQPWTLQMGKRKKETLVSTKNQEKVLVMYNPGPDVQKVWIRALLFCIAAAL